MQQQAHDPVTPAQIHARALLGQLNTDAEQRRLARITAREWLKRIARGDLIVVEARHAH